MKALGLILIVIPIWVASAWVIFIYSGWSLGIEFCISQIPPFYYKMGSPINVINWTLKELGLFGSIVSIFCGLVFLYTTYAVLTAKE